MKQDWLRPVLRMGLNVRNYFGGAINEEGPPHVNKKSNSRLTISNAELRSRLDST